MYATKLVFCWFILQSAYHSNLRLIWGSYRGNDKHIYSFTKVVLVLPLLPLAVPVPIIKSRVCFRHPCHPMRLPYMSFWKTVSSTSFSNSAGNSPADTNYICQTQTTFAKNERHLPNTRNFCQLRMITRTIYTKYKVKLCLVYTYKRITRLLKLVDSVNKKDNLEIELMKFF